MNVFYGAAIQGFNADMIYGKDHIISAVDHAIRSISQNTNTTNSLEKEILLYSSGERQLKLAIPKMGIIRGNSKIALVFIGENLSKKSIDEFLKIHKLNQNDKVLEGDIETLKNFGLNKNEISTVTKDKYKNLILEKVALVDIIK